MPGATAAAIVVERVGTGYADRLRAYRVILDGVKVGRVRRGESLRVETNAGEHELHLSIDWCRSRSILFGLTAGGEARFEARPGLGGRKLSGAPLYATVGRSDYIGLELVEKS